MSGLVVLVTGLIAREFGAAGDAQVLAAGCIAVSSVLLIVGHTLSTTTDLLVWTLLSWLVVRSLRDGGRGWLIVVVFMATSGEPYYLAGFFPVLLAAGSTSVLRWARASTVRRWLLGIALALSLAVSGVLGLPLVPAEEIAATPILALNPDAGGTVGWLRFADTIARVRAGLPDQRVAVLTQNYGEAGAVDHYLPALRPAHSGQNSYWFWGPPPDDATAVIVIDVPEPPVRALFGRVELATRIDDGIGLHNEEQGKPVWVAREPVAPGAGLAVTAPAQLRAWSR